MYSVYGVYCFHSLHTILSLLSLLIVCAYVSSDHNLTTVFLCIQCSVLITTIRSKIREISLILLLLLSSLFCVQYVNIFSILMYTGTHIMCIYIYTVHGLTYRCTHTHTQTQVFRSCLSSSRHQCGLSSFGMSLQTMLPLHTVQSHYVGR